MAPKYAFFNFNVYRKILLFYFALVIFTIVIICVTLYVLFSRSTIAEISHSSQARLDQTSYTSELIYEKVSSLANIMNNDPQIVDVLYASHKNPVDEFNAKRRMDTITSAYPFIKYVGIYNQATKRYVTDQGVPAFASQDSELLETLNSGSLTDYINFMPRKSTFFLNAKEERVLTYIIRPDFYLRQEKGAFIVINVDGSYILQLIHSMMSHNADQIFVLDANGTVLSNTNPELFLTNMLERPYIRHILSGDGKNGYFTASVDGIKQLVTYVKSDTLHWYFISVQPYNQLITNTIHLRNVTLFIAVILILASAVFSAVFLRDLYAPISALVERVRESLGGHPGTHSRYNEFEVLSEAFTHTIDRANRLETSYNKNSLSAFAEADGTRVSLIHPNSHPPTL